MSRVSVEGDGREHHHSTGSRVYVNNMNTPYPNVSLPERTPCSLHERSAEPRVPADSYVGSRVTPTQVPHSGSGPYRASGKLPQSQQVQGALAGGESAAAQQPEAAPLMVNGEAVHANLHDVYRRIMRRLQHQLNYAELSRASLAEQYGIHLELECGWDQQELKAVEHGQRQSTKRRSPPLPPASSSSSTKQVLDDAEAGTGRRSAFRLSKGSRVSMVTAKAPAHDSPRSRDDSPTAERDGGGDGRKSSSRLTQFQLMERLPGTGSARGSTAEAAGDAELERDIAGQPCPLPLRLVIQHVMGTLQKKLSLAESGSLKDCIVFSFESRALLDRLLKEIPLYSQYSASRGKAATGAAQQDIAQVFQELRRKPLLVPRAGYVEDRVTGAIRGQILDDGAARSQPASAQAATVLLPAIVNVPRDLDTAGSGKHGALTGGTSALADAQLPSGYGKSSRLNVAAPQGGALNGVAGHVSQCRQVLRDHLSGGSAAGGYSSSPSDVTATPESLAMAKEAASGHKELAEASAAPPSAFAAAHHATCLASVGTVTEENSLTMVPKADYAALQQQIEMLEAQLADAHMHRRALTNQLCEEAQYTEQKKCVLQYLRETLLRECTMLRSQLHLASGRVQHLQQQQHSQHQLPRGAVSPSGISDAINEGPNTSISVLGPMRMHKQYGPSTAPSMALSLSGDGQLKQQYRPPRLISGQRLSTSGSIGSVCGGIYGSGGRGRSAAMQLHANGANASLGASLSAIPSGAGAPVPGIPSFCVVSSSGPAGAAGGEQQPNDLEAVTSLLDLVLLAVEEDAKLPSHTLQVVRGGCADVAAAKFDFRKDAKQQIDGMRIAYDERQHALKKSMLIRTAEHNCIVAEQKHEVERLRALTDTTQVRAVLHQHVSGLRQALHQLRAHVAEQLHFFKAILYNTTQSLLRRSALVDKTLSENVVLSARVRSMQDMVESAGALLMPMLTTEYRCGYHPWPLRLRNTTDPLAHIIHLRYGASEAIRLRDSLSVFSQLYTTLHHFIMSQIVLPDSTRPSAGKPLQHLCAALALNPMSHTDVVFAARHAYDAEMQLCKKLARLNMKIMWNAHLQRVYTNRSLAALVEAGLNPRQAALPVASRINALAKERAALLQARVNVQRERAENSKVTYRLWQEKEIDIMEGYPTPQTQRNRLALLSSGAAGGKHVGPVSFGRGSRRSTMQGQ
ncbi:hypothetical protein LSCM1_05897 [Leishmania martiniquensis]|uniref:Uncharacterized protein n=1 Tax=Leishmania martiniquensis TaxID=1580590 RepID=A0A836KZZ8_9TRYP|nr:hypothetical protein LSCM1_05897 [Leishmania martiniquensis]